MLADSLQFNNRLLGPYIRSSREGRGMRRRDKAIALSLLWIGIGATAIWSVESVWLRLVLLGIATGVSIHVVRLPAFRFEGVRQGPSGASL